MIPAWLKMAAACLLLAAIYAFGRHDGAAIEQAAQTRAVRAAAAASSSAQTQIDKLTADAARAEQDRQSSVREVRHETKRVIERPIYRTVCVDPDGVQLIAKAAAIANGESQSVASGAAASPAGPASQP
jgi:hypothetical protein